MKGLFAAELRSWLGILTLDSGINVGVRLLIFEKFWSKKKLKMIAMPRLM